MPKHRASKIAILLATIVFLLDFGTKYYVSNHLPLIGPHQIWFPYGGIGVFRSFLGIDFSIVHAINLGAAWGILSQYQGYLLVGRIILIIGVALYALFFNKNRSYDIPLTLIITGATANVMDYFIYGHVVDMFYFIFFGYHYPVFNVADSAICIGVAWLIFIPNQKQRVGEDVT